MHDHVGMRLTDGAIDCPPVQCVGDDGLGAGGVERGDLLWRARHRHDVVAAIAEGRNEALANRTRRPGNEYSHLSSPIPDSCSAASPFSRVVDGAYARSVTAQSPLGVVPRTANWHIERAPTRA